jgi:hypothetical protein
VELAPAARSRVRTTSLAVAGAFLAAAAAAAAVEPRAAVLLAIVVLGWTQLAGL